MIAESVLGLVHADVLTGDGGVNLLLGGSGNDTLNGGKGDDTMDGGLSAGQLIRARGSTPPPTPPGRTP